MRYFLIFLIVAFTTTSQAQSYLTKKTATGKALKWYESAKSDAYNKDYASASKTLEKLLRSYPNFIDAQLLKAQIAFDTEQYDAAAQAFEKVLSIDANYNPRVYYMFGMNEWQRDKFARSAGFLKRFLDSNPRSEDRKKRAERFARNARFAADAVRNPVPFNPTALSNNINTDRPEYAPSFTVDDNTLIFTRRVLDTSGPRAYVHEDFFMSKRENGTWQAAQAMTGINTRKNEGGHSISADGKLLVFTACDHKGGQGGCDIFYTEVRTNAWTRPQSLGTTINTKASETLPSLSADGRTLIFASNRKGGKGNKDLWMSQRRSDGRWGAAKNLGEDINTSHNEDAPFLHPDGQTLYFMSDGHPGMGGQDLFYSSLQADGTWGTPVNLGYPINTKGNEGALTLSLDGTTAYFASDKTDAKLENIRERDIDIYTFPMPASLRPKPVTYVQATVRDAVSKQLLEAVEVTFTILKTGQTYGSSRTDTEGEFLTILPSNKDYALSVDKAGYVFHSEHFALESGLPDKPFQLEIELVPIQETPSVAVQEKPIVLKNIFFDTGSARLLPASRMELEHLGNLLKNNPKMRIQINGHTDNVGDDSSNMRLSEARAKAVYNDLIQQGVSAARLRYKGFGESQAIASNDTETGRQTNRRTEFVLW